MSESDPRISKTGWWNGQILRSQLTSNRRKRNSARDVLCDAICRVIPPGCSVVDMGAGPGWLVEDLLKKGYDAWGLEGCQEVEAITKGLVKTQDLTGNCDTWIGSAEWGVFYEVGEHIPKEYETKLIDNVSWIPKNGLIVSWATVQGTRMSSEGHVNCRHPLWVASQFGLRGWIVQEELTKRAIETENMRRGLRRRLMVFTRARRR